MTRTFIIHAQVEYDDDYTDPESLCTAVDRLLETSLSTPGILDEYGQVAIGEFRCDPNTHCDCGTTEHVESTYCGSKCPSCLEAHCNACEVCARDFRGTPPEPTDMELRAKARQIHAVEGEVEIDDDAEVSRAESGAYVQAWVRIEL